MPSTPTLFKGALYYDGFIEGYFRGGHNIFILRTPTLELTDEGVRTDLNVLDPSIENIRIIRYENIASVRQTIFGFVKIRPLNNEGSVAFSLRSSSGLFGDNTPILEALRAKGVSPDRFFEPRISPRYVYNIIMVAIIIIVTAMTVGMIALFIIRLPR